MMSVWSTEVVFLLC